MSKHDLHTVQGLQLEMAELTLKALMDRCDRDILAQRCEMWRKLAIGYDDMRYELRNCDDTPGGHKKFYDECSKIIFGYSPGIEEEDDDDSGDDVADSPVPDDSQGDR